MAGSEMAAAKATLSARENGSVMVFDFAGKGAEKSSVRNLLSWAAAS
jgi:hypothetical protein